MRTRPSLNWLLVALVVIAVDQYTKRLITAKFELFDRMAVVPFFDLVRLHNTGAAFSFLANASGWQNWFFTGVALAVSAVILWWFLRQPAGRIVVPLGLCAYWQSTRGLQPVDIWTAILTGHATRCLLSVARFRQGKWRHISVEIDGHR